MRLPIDPSLRRALKTCAVELDALDADWAVAGATAMQAGGYSRATRDIDLFIGDDARADLIARLRARGLPVQGIFPPHHYRVAGRSRRDPEASIDLLFPALGVESLGLLAATRMPIEGMSMPVVPIHHLVALKLATDPHIDPSRYTRDVADLLALHERGLVDPIRVRQVLEDAREVEGCARLSALMGGTLGAPSGPSEPTTPSTRPAKRGRGSRRG